MPAAYTILQSYNGASTRDWVDGVNYSLTAAGWSPQVSGLRSSPLGGRGPYEDVTEKVGLNVLGTTGAIALANLAALVEDLMQAQRWRRGDDVAPVIFKVQPQGSTLTNPLQVVMMGPPPDEDPRNLLGLPLTFNDVLMVYEIGPVDVRFWRPGALLGDVQTSTTSASGSHPSVLSATFSAAVNLFSPLSVAISGFTGSIDGAAAAVGSDVYLVVSDDADKIEVGEAEACSAVAPGLGTFNTSADSRASGGSIRRLVPGTLGEYSLTKAVTLAGTRNNAYVILVAVRNNSSSIRYTTYAKIGNNIVYNRVSSPQEVIEATNTRPQIIRYDPIVFDGAVTEVQLIFSPSATGSSAHQLDVDVFVITQVDEASRIIALYDINRQTTIAGSIEINDQALTRPMAQVVESASGVGDILLAYEGDPFLSSIGSEVAICMIGTTDTDWRVINGTVGSGSAVSSQLSATRLPAYLVPQ